MSHYFSLYKTLSSFILDSVLFFQKYSMNFYVERNPSVSMSDSSFEPFYIPSFNLLVWDQEMSDKTTAKHSK